MTRKEIGEDTSSDSPLINNALFGTNRAIGRKIEQGMDVLNEYKLDANYFSEIQATDVVRQPKLIWNSSSAFFSTREPLGKGD